MTSEIRKVYCTPEEQARLWLSHNGYRTLAGGSEYVSGPPLYEIMAQYHEWMTQGAKHMADAKREFAIREVFSADGNHTKTFDENSLTELLHLFSNSVQSRIANWGIGCFGTEHMSNSQTRGLRLLEEAMEFSQSIGITKEKCAELLEYVYSRPIGHPEQELGGIGVCLYAAAHALGQSADDLTEREITRCESKSSEHFATREKAKVDVGLTND